MLNGCRYLIYDRSHKQEKYYLKENQDNIISTIFLFPLLFDLIVLTHFFHQDMSYSSLMTPLCASAISEATYLIAFLIYLLKTSSFWITVPYPGNAVLTWEDAHEPLAGGTRYIPPRGFVKNRYSSCLLRIDTRQRFDHSRFPVIKLYLADRIHKYFDHCVSVSLGSTGTAVFPDEFLS